MGRDQNIEFVQDRLGNERRKLDDVRAYDGSDAGGDNNGLIEISGGEVDADVVAYVPDDDVSEYYLTGIRAFNAGDSAGQFYISEAELDADGNPTSIERRTVDLDMAAESTRAFGYNGAPFEGVITINSDFEGQISVTVVPDRPVYEEPESENY